MLEVAEHGIDAVAILVASVVWVSRHLAVGSWWNDRQNAAQEQVFAEPVAVIALVGEQTLGSGQRQGHQIIGGSIVRGLSAGQTEAERTSWIVRAGVDLARKAAA